MLSSVPYRVSVWSILLCGAAAGSLLYYDARRSEELQAENEFGRQAMVRHAFTREILGRYAESLFGLSTLFMVDSNVTRPEFIQATTRLQERLTGAQAFEWVPAVSEENRAAVEAAMQKVYPRRGFEFVSFDAVGRPSRAPSRPVYYPICYAEPLRGNEIVLGYDLMTAPTRAFLERARDTRRMQVTSQFRLVQERSNQAGIIMVWPVYRMASTNANTFTASAAAVSGGGTSTTAGEVFMGFLQCVFRVHDLFETTRTAQPDTILDMLFVDASENDAAKRVMYYRPADNAVPRSPAPSEAEFLHGQPFHREFPLEIGERDWRVVYRPRTDWVAAQRSTMPFVRGGGVLMLSALLAGLVSVIGRRTETIQREVKERTAELADSRRQIANLLHALPGMAYRFRFNDHVHVLFASEGTRELTGYSAEEWLAGSVRVRDVIHPDDVDRVRDAARAAVDTRKDYELEFRIRPREAAEKWVLSRGRGVYGPDGQLEVIEGLAIDITARKQAESARLALERKLQDGQKLESLGLLAGGIAHDFNNLLSTILGNASMARMALPPGGPIDPQLRSIESASLRAAELCRQMLAYAGKGRFVVERVDLSALVEDLLPLLRISMARQAMLTLDLKRELPAVRADATQLRQVLMNLVLNAVDAMANRDGEITIRTGVTTVDKALLASCVAGAGMPLGEYVFLEVRDTGCGMTADVQSRIFDPFFTTKFAGRGLGLPAVLGIVRGHNGAIQVESAVDHGSTFRIYLPAVLEPARIESTPAAAPASPVHYSGDVLVIEDEESVRTVLVQMLKSFGFGVEGVADGRTAVEKFRENAGRWSLLVLDLVMPGMSGEQTLGAVRAINADVRVLLISGYAEGDIMSRIRGDRGRIAFLAKPFRREAFEEKLRELLA